MKALAESTSTTTPPITEIFELGNDDGDDITFYRSCLEEIDRYRRIDEWIPSYHNVLSTTALECKQRLAKTGGIPIKAADFLQYTQEGCYDELRYVAFKCLMDLGLSRNCYILRWFLFVLGSDPSSYVRDRMIYLLGRTLGSIAIGHPSSGLTSASTAQESTGLIIEQESSTAARQADLARKQTIPGALAALKAQLTDNATLKTALWQAIESPALNLHQLAELLEICTLLYTPENSMLVVLKLPRYWQVRSHGRTTVPGSTSHKSSLMLIFSQTTKVRTKEMPKPKLPLPQPATAPPPPLPPPPPPLQQAPVQNYPALKRSGSSFGPTPTPTPLKLSIKPPKKPGTPGLPPSAGMVMGMPAPGTPGTPADGAKPKLTLKLNLKGPGGKPGGPSTPRG